MTVISHGSDKGASKKSPPPKKPSRPIPRLGGGLPFLGQALGFQRNPLAVLERGYAEHGPVFGFELAGSDFVLFASPEAHDAYFRAAEDHLSAKEVYQFTVPIFGKNVAYDAPRSVMDQQLGFLLPALGQGHLRRYVDLMVKEIEDYIAPWGDEGVVDLPKVTNDLTVHIASRCLLGDEIRERLYDGFADLYHDLQLGINTVGFFAPRVPTIRHIKRDRARKKVVELIGGVVAERRASGRQAQDFLQTLMEARYQDGRALTDDEITGLLLTVLFGGQHTSCVLAAWVGVELFSHKSFLPPVLDELESLYGPVGAPMAAGPSLASLKKSERLHRVIMEGERMHPPLILLVRKVLKDFHYDGYTVPAGTLAMVAPGLSHRLRSVFADPHTFDPDRFAKPREEHKQHPLTLIGFGGGKHRCVGMGFAYLQLKAIWSVLLHRFDFELASPVPGPDYSNWVTGPLNPCNVRYRRRRPRS